MFNRKSMLFLCGVVAALLTAASAQVLGNPFTRINHLTFNKPFTLPGVVLAPGAYTFEEGPAGMTRDIVLVRARHSQTPLYQGFTRAVPRPRSLPGNRTVEFGESATGAPTPIAVWYPLGSEGGHEFLYR